jgi:cysteinyl-tRNA synthetase
MDDDFNSSGALAQFFELVRVINQTRADGATDVELKTAQDTLLELTGVLGLTLQQEKQTGQKADSFVDLLIEIRKDLRENKQWALSDKVRDRLVELGVVLEDGKGGTLWHWK